MLAERSNQSNSHEIDKNIETQNFGSLFNSSSAKFSNSRKHQNQNQNQTREATLHDLEDDVPLGTIPTISQHVANGYAGKTIKSVPQKPGQNGNIPNGRPNFRNMLEDAENYQIDSHM